MPETMTASTSPLTKPQEQAQPQPQEPKAKKEPKTRRERDLLAEIKALEEKKQALITQHKKAETRKKIIFGGLAINAFKEIMKPGNQEEIRKYARAILDFIGKAAADKDKETVKKIINEITTP